MIHACKLAQADCFIQSFPDGYDTYIEQGGTNVSGGQKQRLCIAPRAFEKSQGARFWTTPPSAVDTATDALIRQAFREEIPNVTKINHRPARGQRDGRGSDRSAGRGPRAGPWARTAS